MMPGEKKEEKKKCKYEWRVDKCSREALPGDEHCIFHSKDIEGKKKDFKAAFWAEFERQGKCEEEYDFSGFVFPGNISFKKVQFSKDARFRRAKFTGEANFWQAKFSGWANFWSAQFSGKPDFGQAQFSGNAYFEHAQFKNVNFQLAKFSGKAYFRDAKFSGVSDFKKAKFLEDANFENIEIEKFSSIKMIDTYFYNVSGLFEFVEENDKVFKKLRKRSWTLKTEFLPKNFKLILGDGVMARYPVIARQIRDDIYLMDKRERNSKMKGKKKCWYKSLYFLWWLFANYGRSFKRWAVWSLGFALIFAIIFYLYFLESPSNFQTVYISEGFKPFSFFYYSVVTFTTLGFGDIVPKCGWLQLWVMLEVILGYIMLGGLISIFANKLARRS
jgi:hypothetical protein